MFVSLLLALALGQAPAQNVRPQIGYVYPPGGKPGTTIEVRLGTYDWTPDTEIICHDERMKIEVIGPPGEYIITPPPYWFGPKASQAQPPLAREVPARITLAADMPPETLRWQAANANGGSNVGQFVVSDTDEYVEPDQRNGPLEILSLPITISGRLSRITEVDEYRFTAPSAGLVHCRLEGRLGQPFFGVLSIHDAQGRKVADAADTTGIGAEVLFVAAPGQTYTARIHDLEFGGDAGYVYRLRIAREAKVVATVPAVVGRGVTQEVEFVGWGVATGRLQLESAVHTVSVPAEAPGDTFHFVFETPAGPARAVLSLGEHSDTLAAPPETSVPLPITIPAQLSGALDRLEPLLGMPGQRFEFAAKKGESVRFTVEAQRFGSALDPSLLILSPEGKELARNDDLPSTTDAGLDFRAPADGVYQLVVFDVSGLPPARSSAYRLLAEPALPDFTLTVPEQFSVPLGGTADLLLRAVRQGGWKEPIALKLEGLPEGVSITGPAEIPQGRNDVRLAMSASDTAAARASTATLVATATVGEHVIERRFGPILVSSIIKTRCKVKSAVQDGGRIVNRGTTYPADVIIERLEGYEGPVTLQMAATQSRQRRGIRSDALIVPSGKSEVQYPIFMPEWLETNLTCRMNLIGVVQVPDPQGNLRYVCGAMDGQIVMSIEGGLLKLSHEPEERVVRPGQAVQIPVRISRSARLEGEARIEISPDLAHAGILTVRPITLAAHESAGVVEVTIDEDAPASSPFELRLRATVLQDGRWPAVSETAVPLHISPASQ